MKVCGWFLTGLQSYETSLVEEALNFFGGYVMCSKRSKGSSHLCLMHVREKFPQWPLLYLKSSIDDQGFSLVHNDPLSRLYSER